MLHSWTSTLVRFHIEKSSIKVHTARQVTSNKPGQRHITQLKGHIMTLHKQKANVSSNSKSLFPIYHILPDEFYPHMQKEKKKNAWILDLWATKTIMLSLSQKEKEDFWFQKYIDHYICCVIICSLLKRLKQDEVVLGVLIAATLPQKG